MESTSTTTMPSADCITATKKCSHCGEIKPITEFSKSNKSKDGLQCWCKRCACEYTASKYHSERPQVAPPQAVTAPHPIYSKMSPREIQAEIRDRINYLRSEGWECDVKMRYVQVREITL